MKKPYFLLYRKARELFDNKKVFLETVKDEGTEKTIFVFKCNDHLTTLSISKIPNTTLWLRHWGCDCEHYSLWQDKSECKHIVAATYYLVSGGYDKVNNYE